MLNVLSLTNNSYEGSIGCVSFFVGNGALWYSVDYVVYLFNLGRNKEN